MSDHLRLVDGAGTELVDLDALRRAIEPAAHASPDQLADAVQALGRARAELEVVTAALFTRAAVLASRSRDAIAEPDESLTVKQAAAAIGMSPDFVRDHRDELGGFKQGSALRYSARRIEEYKRERASGATLRRGR